MKSRVVKKIIAKQWTQKIHWKNQTNKSISECWIKIEIQLRKKFLNRNFPIGYF